MAEKDIYIKNYLFPEAKRLFDCSLKPISEINKDCLFIIDTNALLVPYTVSNKSLDEIGKIYKKLIDEKRLFIPGQTAREFVNRRPDKVKEIHSKLNQKKDKTNNIFAINTNFPLLKSLTGQEELLQLEKEISEKLKEYTGYLAKVIRQVKDWTWNDPVSSLYKELFKEEIIVDIELDEQLRKDFDKRHSNKVIPGYKDAGKQDEGIGDYLIWRTILTLGKDKSKSTIFVSGEEKPDWWYRSEKERLYPRFELVHEYERECSNSFHIVKLSELLEMFGADKAIVEEVQNEEKPQEKLIPDTSSITARDDSDSSPLQAG